MSMALRSISACGSDDEGFVLCGYFLRLPGAGRILQHGLKTTALMVPFPHLGDREMGTPQRFRDLPVSFPAMREQQNARTSDAAGVVFATFYDLFQGRYFVLWSYMTVYRKLS